MTDDQKRGITRLRSAGWGYKRIASFIGVKKETVKSYCRRNDLTGYASRYINQKPVGTIGRCKNCGAIVEQDPKRKA